MVIELFANLVEKLREVEGHPRSIENESILVSDTIYSGNKRRYSLDSSSIYTAQSLSIKSMTNQLFKQINNVFTTKMPKGEHFELSMIDCLGRLTFLELNQYFSCLADKNKLDVEHQANKFIDSFKKDKHFVLAAEKILSSQLLTNEGKHRLLQKYFGFLDQGALSTDKVCSLSRILSRNKLSLNNMHFEDLKKFYQYSLQSLESDKKKIVSNAIRMAGILLTHLDETNFTELLLQPTKSKKDGISIVFDHLTKLLSNSFAKYSWNVTCSLHSIIEKYNILTAGTASKKNEIHTRLEKLCKPLLQQVAKNYTESANVKLKLHSLTLLMSHPTEVFNCLAHEDLVSLATFISLLHSGGWEKKVTPEYSDIKYLHDLKSLSIDLICKLGKHFDESGFESAEYVPVLSCFDSIIDRLKMNILNQGVALEDADEITGKLSAKEYIICEVTKEVKDLIDLLCVMKKKLNRFDDLCLTLNRYDKLSKLTDFKPAQSSTEAHSVAENKKPIGQSDSKEAKLSSSPTLSRNQSATATQPSPIQKLHIGDLIKLENVFVETRVMNE